MITFTLPTATAAINQALYSVAWAQAESEDEGMRFYIERKRRFFGLVRPAASYAEARKLWRDAMGVWFDIAPGARSKDTLEGLLFRIEALRAAGVHIVQLSYAEIELIHSWRGWTK
jgi:hypothetical protein